MLGHEAMRISICCLALVLSGCGVVFQGIAGFSDERAVRRDVQKPVRIETLPQGAEVHRKDLGSARRLGTAPLVDELSYEVIDTVEQPADLTPFWVGTTIDAAVAAGAALGIASDDEFRDDAGAWFGWMITFGALVLSEVVAGALLSRREPVVLATRLEERSGNYRYLVRKPGFPPIEAAVSAPKIGDTIFLPLDPERVVTDDDGVTIMAGNGHSKPRAPDLLVDPEIERFLSEPTMEPSVQPSLHMAQPNLQEPSVARPSLAILPLIDPNSADSRLAIARALRESITELLRSVLAEGGYTILRADAKACTSDACQLGVARQLGASHLLRTKIIRFGPRCVLSGDVVDVALDKNVSTVTASGTCDEEGFFAMSSELAGKLLAPAR